MTLREQQQLAERKAYELRVSDVPLQRNPLNGRFLKGHTPANKGKKWDEYMSRRAQQRARRGWKNLDLHRSRGGPGRPDKPVVAVNDAGKWIYFPSCAEAGRLLGIRYENIRRCCRENETGTKNHKGQINTDHKYKGVRFYFESDEKWTTKIKKT